MTAPGQAVRFGRQASRLPRTLPNIGRRRGANVLGTSIAQNAGVFQVLFKVPQEASEGDLPIRFAVGENMSPEGTVLRVRKAPEAVTHGSGSGAKAATRSTRER